MNFRTTSTIGEQMSHVKKYAPLLLLNIPRKYQYLLYSIPFLAIFADLIFNLLNHIYFLCVFDFFLFIVTIHTIISLRKKIIINVNLKMYSFDHLRMYNIDHINTFCSRR